MRSSALVLLAACCVTVVLADDAATCTGIDRLKVKSQWNALFGVTEQRRIFGTKLWKAVFHIEPKIKEGISKLIHSENVYSTVFQAFIARSLGTVDVLIGLLDDPDTLQAHINFLKADFRARNVPPVYVKVLAQALQEVAPEQLGECFDEDAWSGCWQQLIKDTQIPPVDPPASS